MNIVDKIAKMVMCALLTWYFFSLYVCIGDSTLSLGMLLSFEIINILMIIMLIRVLKFGYQSPNFTDISLSFSMIFWFCYSTIRDLHENGYSVNLKIFYVGIDIISMMFLVDTFLNFFLNSGFLILTKEQMNRINNLLKIGLTATFSLIYFNLLRGIK